MVGFGPKSEALSLATGKTRTLAADFVQSLAMEAYKYEVYPKLRLIKIERFLQPRSSPAFTLN
jgi:hypothetical protein